MPAPSHEPKIEALTSGEVIGEAVQQAIETIEAATLAAIMAATSS